MKVSDFVDLSITAIAKLTEIDKANWCKFFAGKHISERTLNKAAAKLKMRPEDLLAAINIRRQNKRCEKSQQVL